MASDPVPYAAQITLRVTTAENLTAILALEVAADQREHYPRSNAYSIAEAHCPHDAIDPDVDGLDASLTRSPKSITTLTPAPDAWFRGIYAGETPVGFVLLSLDPDQSEYSVWRFMIDQRFQHRGYGSRAMYQVIDYAMTLPNAQELTLSHLRGNERFFHFCLHLGFRYTGAEITPGDLLMKLDLVDQASAARQE